MKLPKVTFEQDYTGIVFGFSFYTKHLELTIAFLFWGVVIQFEK